VVFTDHRINFPTPRDEGSAAAGSELNPPLDYSHNNRQYQHELSIITPLLGTTRYYTPSFLIINEVISMKHKYNTITALVLFTVMSATSSAEDVQKSPPMPMKGMGMHHGMGGMGGMMAGMTEEQKDKHMQSMQEHMLKMHDLSNQILAEKDPAKKDVLKKQQLQLMKAHHTEMMESHQQMPMK
jgi:hypothetical protein